MNTLLISAIRLLSLEIERAHFSSKVREQIKQAKMLLDNAQPYEESKIRSGLVLLQSAINNISTNRFHSSLYFLGGYRKDNIHSYNLLCSLVARFYSKLGDTDLYTYWNNRYIEMAKSDFSDFDPVDLSNSH